MTDAVKPIQADRDATVEIARPGKVIAEEIKGGLHDGYYIVQAFARHRIASQADLLSAVREARDKLTIAVSVINAAVPVWMGEDAARTTLARLDTLLSEQGEAS